MFNLGLKRDTRRAARAGQFRSGRGQHEQMATQVRKILETKEQGLIVMVRG